ncbi:MAG: hypothetical protein JWN71_3912 [Xanthobacteraceae bacterium]|jgi:hypothetical protein|nr:hypothetical protein [Xanthobacteraceae bacterium]
MSARPTRDFDYEILGPGEYPPNQIGGFPRGASRRDRVAQLDALATLLDTAFLIPGTNVRFGIDALIGLVPGIGDAITTAMSLWLIHQARQLGAPKHLIARMLGNTALDGLVGIVPFLGDAFDVMFRANRRNMKLLRDWIERDERRGARA